MVTEKSEQLLLSIANGLFIAARDAQAKFDTAKTPEEMAELRILRRLLIKDVPGIIERFVNEDTTERWHMWEWYQMKTKINKNVFPRKPWWRRLFNFG